MIAGTVSGGLELLLDETPAAAKLRAASAFDAAAAPFQRELVLFGAGGFGRRTLAGLRQAGIEPLAFADNNCELWGKPVEGVPVYSPAEAARRLGGSAAFVITIWNGQAADSTAARIRQLQAAGCRRVIPAGFLYWKYPKIFLPHYPMDLPHRVLERRDDVLAAAHLWHDDLSRAEYLAQVAFRLRLDFDGMAAPGLRDHYFPPGLFHLTPSEFLVDCGAFDGDTILSFLEKTDGRFHRIVAFEPDPLNWEKLQRTVAGLPAGVRNRVECFPDAVSAEAGTVLFNVTGTDLSTMGGGALAVRCVELDGVFAGQSPTILKFDIEGAELEALAGAAELVQRCRPILAVSAYHQQSHLWEVPLALHRMASDYRYVLRPHGAEGWDLVCYAIPAERLGEKS